MANIEREYYFAPTWDYPPGGPIKLGNIISSVKKPHRPLATLEPTATDLITTQKSSVTYSDERSKSGEFSLLTKFLSFLGIGVDVGVGRENRLVSVQSVTLSNVPS